MQTPAPTPGPYPAPIIFWLLFTPFSDSDAIVDHSSDPGPAPF